MTRISDAVSWINAPSAYNWISLAIAIFTGYTAFAMWSDRRRSVRTEWHLDWVYGEMPRVKCLIKNGLISTLECERIIVRGPLLDVFAAHQGLQNFDKNESWKPNETPVILTIAPGSSSQISVQILADPDGLRSSALSASSRLGAFFTRWFWRTLMWRVPSGPRFSITLVARRRSAAMRSMRFTHTFRIYADSAIKIAESIEKKDAK